MTLEPEDWEAPEEPWINIEIVTEKQEETIREIAEDWGFKTLAGFAGYLSSHDWNYYDAIRASCRE